MRRPTVLLLAALLAACASPAPVDAPRPALAAVPAPAASPIDFLLDSAAKDFRTHPPIPSAFRHVRYGRFTASDGAVSHRLCGEYQVERTDSEPQWASFATLKTSGYEQWLGETAYCSDQVQWTPGDLSAELQRRFDATK